MKLVVNNTSKKHGQHSTKNNNMLLSPKNKTKVQKNTSQKQNTKTLHIKCINNRYRRGKGQKKLTTPTETTPQTHSKKECEKTQHEKHSKLAKKYRKNTGKKRRTNI